MQIVIQPPREARPGEILVPPLMICLRTPGNYREDENVVEDLGSYWAAVSMVSEDGMIALAPPSTTLLSGTLVDSVHEAYQAEDESEIGYFVFQNLRIHEPGNFRLRISLMQMPTSRHQTLNAGGNTTQSSSARNTGNVITHVIRIHECAPVAYVGMSPHLLETKLGCF